MNQTSHPEPLCVLYDGACPLCRREISHARGLAERQGNSALSFIDISAGADGSACFAADRPRLLARFHVQRADGTRLDGAAAFVAMWQRLPGWRWLAQLAKLPGVLSLMELAYRGFLHLRPGLQRLARHWDTEPSTTGAAGTAGLSPYLERELRSDHAGETGAVYIYRGIATLARWRKDTALLEFAMRHGSAEAEHLGFIEAWLAPGQRSRLLIPWRLAGWLTGALPALAGQRVVYATIAAVETFVDQHYQQQIEHLERHGGPDGLLRVLLRCQADERHHRDEASALAGGATPWIVRTWCRLVGAGSAAAVVLARRI